MSEMQEGADATSDVKVSPSTLPAGVETPVVIEVTCTPPRDLAGRVLALRREDGEVVLKGELGEDLDGSNATGETPLLAPAEPGEHGWLAVLLAENEQQADEVLGPVSASVERHRTKVLVWDVPPAVTHGEPFRFKVGLKCLSGCRHDAWTVAVRDASGAELAVARPGDEPWQGTTALYWSEVEVSPQADEGHHRWTARFEPPESGLPHEAAEIEFGVHVVPRPEYWLRVEAYDRKVQAPVRRARVVLHPYRAFTDETGVAALRVAGGEYRLFVSGGKFIPFTDTVRVEGDVTIRAELDEDRGLSVEDIWA